MTLLTIQGQELLNLIFWDRLLKELKKNSKGSLNEVRTRKAIITSNGSHIIEDEWPYR